MPKRGWRKWRTATPRGFKPLTADRAMNAPARVNRVLTGGYRGRADCIVYDASGKAIAKINAETRERTPL